MAWQTQFDNNVLTSFYLWAEARLGNNLNAFETYTYPLYYAPDPAIPPSYYSYSFPFASWMYDSSVSGAAVISVVSGGNTVYNRASGFVFDYTNARVLVPTGFGPNLTITGTASFKTANIYIPNETEQQIITQSKFYLNPNYNGAVTNSGIPPYVYCTPCVFCNQLHSDSVAFTFGGVNDTPSTMSLSIFAESNFQLSALLSLFRDARYDYIPYLNVTGDPLNWFGDFKNGTGYSYAAYVQQYGTPGNLMYISAAKTSKVSDKVKVNREYFIGLVDLTLNYQRITT